MTRKEQINISFIFAPKSFKKNKKSEFIYIVVINGKNEQKSEKFELWQISKYKENTFVNFYIKNS